MLVWSEETNKVSFLLSAITSASLRDVSDYLEMTLFSKVAIFLLC